MKLPQPFFTLLAAGLMLWGVGCAPVSSTPPSLQEAAPAPRLPGMERSVYIQLEGHRVYYEVGGQGSPVVMVHGIGAGNSSHLWRQNTAALAREHRVYAFDWPGFARSGAQSVKYTNELYVKVLKAFIEQVVGQPTAIVASSLGSDYSVRLAVEQPRLITRLVVSNPAGYDVLEAENKDFRVLVSSSTRANQRFYDQLTTTPLGDLVFSLVTGEGGLNFFLYFSVYWDSSLVTPEITQLYLQNLQGVNKQFAPFAFFSGFLEQPIKSYWPKLTQPALLVWGKDDVFTPIRYAQQMLNDRPNTQFQVLRGRAIPYEEDAVSFNKLALDFLR